MAAIYVTWTWEFSNISTDKKEAKDNRYNAVWMTMEWQDQVHVEAQLPRSCVSSDVSVRKMFRAAAKCLPQAHRGGIDNLLTEKDARKMSRRVGRLIRDRLYSRTEAKQYVATENGCSRRTLERAIQKWNIKIEVKGRRRFLPLATFPDSQSGGSSGLAVREFKPNPVGGFDQVKNSSSIPRVHNKQISGR